MASVSPQQLRRVGLVVCLGISALFISHSLNAFVADALTMLPVHPAESSHNQAMNLAAYSPAQSAEEIRSSGLFLLPPPPPPQTPQGGSPQAGRAAGMPVRASLGLTDKIRLLGVVMGDRQGVFAIIEELSTKKQGLYRLYEEVLDFGEISQIRRDGVAIRQGNIEEFLGLELAEHPSIPGTPPISTAMASPTPAPGAPLRKVIDRREVESAMNDLPKLLSQARAAPYMLNGNIDGYRLEYVEPASFYEKIGVQRGDVLQRVNGVDIRDPSTMLSLLQQLKNERTVKLDLVRSNQRSTITYELR